LIYLLFNLLLLLLINIFYFIRFILSFIYCHSFTV